MLAYKKECGSICQPCDLILCNINQIQPHFLTKVNGIPSRKADLYGIKTNKMKINHKIITGSALILMAITAMLAMSIPEQLSLRIICWTLIVLLDILVAWGLYYIFQEVHKEISSLAAILRLIYAGILAMATTFLIVAKTSPAGDLQTVLLDSFEKVWSWGLVIFGLHLILIGWLAIKDAKVPKWLGIVIIIGGFGYLLVHLSPLFLVDASKIVSILEMVFMAPMIVGELGLAIWLLIKWKH
jgi:hypothetical protein